MAEKWRFGGIELARGEKTVGFLDVARMADGTTLRLAVHALAGARAGPTLCLLGTEHGDETLGLDIIRRVWSELDPRAVSGQVVAVPVVNPLSFAAQTYHTPQDMKNVHALYPGTIDGSITEKIASIIASNVLDNVNILINIHGAGRHVVNNFTYVPDLGGELSEKSLELAKTFGQKVLFRGPVGAGYSVSYAARKTGAVGIMVELGSDLNWPAEAAGFVETGARGVKNVLIHEGMMRGEVERPDQQVLIKARKTVRARHGGMFHPKRGLESLGEVVAKGAILGVTVDPHTFEELETLRVPFEKGLLFMVRGRGQVHPGDYMFHIGDMASAENVS